MKKYISVICNGCLLTALYRWRFDTISFKVSGLVLAPDSQKEKRARFTTCLKSFLVLTCQEDIETLAFIYLQGLIFLL